MRLKSALSGWNVSSDNTESVNKMGISLRRISIAVLLSVVLGCAGCDQSVPVDGTDTDADTSAPVETTAPKETETKVPETTEPVTSAPETTEKAPETTAPTETSSDTTASADTKSENEPEFVNPLTGLASEKDYTGKRPAAIMINNIKASCPQVGVSEADIMYECLVEGGYTRLMMVVQDYASLPKVGSVRSSRDYYLDFAADYNAIYVHAGGSPYAYDDIQNLGVNNLDGVNMWLPNQVFYRDEERLATMALEHTLVTTGEKIAYGVSFKKYSTEMDKDFDYPLDFVPFGTTVAYENAAKNIHIPYSFAHNTDFKYDEESGTYLRYQFGGLEHIDGATDEQLKFDNLIIYFCETGRITGDASLRIEVGTIGEGKGFYATKGTYIPITWKKESYESPTKFYDAEGNLLLINRGKTFVSVCPTSITNTITFN